MLVTNFRFKYAVYKLVCAVFQAFDVGRIHPVRERSLRALNATVDYIEANMADAMGFETQLDLMRWTLSEVNVGGHYLEFGVFRGGTIRFIAKLVGRQQLIHGFDSFEGLPEGWSGFQLGRGAFSTGGRLPRVPGNVSLHKGLFEETLPKWRETYDGPVAFIHNDSDLYSSTVTLFETLADRLQVGTVILFDEYFNYPNWENHEYKAWREFVDKYKLTYEYLGYARQQAALRITNIGTLKR